MIFKEIVDKHFSKGNLIGKVFNKKKLKLSYSCVGSLKSKFSAHNRKILSKGRDIAMPKQSCNCQNKAECPMDGNCVCFDVVYQAEVCKATENKGEGKLYLGLASGNWKARYANHRRSFNDRSRVGDTELAKYVWDLKDNN